MALGLWDKIRDTRISSEPIVKQQRPSHGYPGGVSDIVRHRNRLGYHVATTHRITMPDGSVPHWDCKDLRVGDVILWCG